MKYVLASSPSETPPVTRELRWLAIRLMRYGKRIGGGHRQEIGGLSVFLDYLVEVDNTNTPYATIRIAATSAERETVWRAKFDLFVPPHMVQQHEPMIEAFDGDMKDSMIDRLFYAVNLPRFMREVAELDAIRGRKSGTQHEPIYLAYWLLQFGTVGYILGHKHRPVDFGSTQFDASLIAAKMVFPE